MAGAMGGLGADVELSGTPTAIAAQASAKKPKAESPLAPQTSPFVPFGNCVLLYMAKQKELHQRDLSWLGFNQRVLEEAADSALPLFERIKFLAIYSSNLEEFFRVRVAAIRQLLHIPSEAKSAQSLLAEISERVDQQQRFFGGVFFEEIIPALKSEGIDLMLSSELPLSCHAFVRNYFMREVLHQLQPILLVKSKVVPFLQNGALYLAVALVSRKSKVKDPSKRRLRYAMVQIPGQLPRFLSIPGQEQRHLVLFIDDVIRNGLDQLFPGYEIVASHSFKLSRDADLRIEDEFTGNLIEKLRESLIRRKTGAPSRFLYDQRMPEAMLDFFKASFDLDQNDMVPGGRYHNFSDFFSFPNPFAPQLERPLPQPLHVAALDAFPSMFEAIKRQDWLLSFPYQSYDYVLRFLNQAAIDPKVTEIQATQYRVASDSAVVNALISAARNGKKVTVFVELKARFDEEANLYFADRMEQAGVRIMYSVPGLKVHAKACLVTRKSRNSQGFRQYAFISTGNFNEKTARLYCDHGYFTSRADICRELGQLFVELDYWKQQSQFKKIQVARFNMVDTYRKAIKKEISAAKAGCSSGIFLKVNNLEEPGMIQALYEAAEAGVPVRVMVRSICCLVPGKVQVRRLVDKFLEHARVVMFHNQGEDRVFLSSADWMTRNLYHRIELGLEIKAEPWRQQLLHMYELQWRDNRAARDLDASLNMHPVDNQQPEFRAQEAIYAYLKESSFPMVGDLGG